jgi:hypothetical protein
LNTSTQIFNQALYLRSPEKTDERTPAIPPFSFNRDGNSKVHCFNFSTNASGTAAALSITLSDPAAFKLPALKRLTGFQLEYN